MRSFSESDALLARSGFCVLNAFREYRQNAAEPSPTETPILLFRAE
ncbi:MAG: hypothetical protein ACR2PL_26710 [Dehalococcoidia bacterium]